MDNDVKDNTPDFETGSMASSPSETNQSESQNSSESELKDFLEEMSNNDLPDGVSKGVPDTESSEGRKDDMEDVGTTNEKGVNPKNSDTKEQETKSLYPREEERKQQLNNEIRSLTAERDRIKAEVAKYKEFEIPSVEQVRNYLMDQDPEMSEADADMQARVRINEAVMQRQEQIDQITGVRHEQQLAAYQASQEYPELFDSSHPDFDREVVNEIMEVFETTAAVRRAEDGGVIAANTELYPFLKTVGEIHRAGLAKGKSVGEAEVAAEKAKMEAESKARKSEQSRAGSSSPLYPSGGGIKGKTDGEELNEFVKSMLAD